MENINKESLLKAFDEIGKISVFSNIKDACLSGFFNIEANRLSEMDEILRCINLYIILKNIKNLTGRKLEVLSYYLKFGYNKQTKKDIVKVIKITPQNLNNINHELRKMGLIYTVGYNKSYNEVNKELLKFKEFIVDNKGKYISIKIE